MVEIKGVNAAGRNDQRSESSPIRSGERQIREKCASVKRLLGGDWHESLPRAAFFSCITETSCQGSEFCMGAADRVLSRCKTNVTSAMLNLEAITSLGLTGASVAYFTISPCGSNTLIRR